MEWRRGTLQEALGHTLYDDKFGIHRLEISSIQIYDDGTQDWIDDNGLYYKQGEKYILFRKGGYDYSSSLDKLFKVKFAKRKNIASNSSYWPYYGIPNELTMNEVENIDFSKVNIKLRVSRMFFEGNYRNERHENSFIIFAKPSELKEKNYLICVGETKFLNIEPKLKDLKIGAKYYYQPSNCSCEVTKIYDYPNKDGLLFDVKLVPSGLETITIKEAKRVYILPYLETNELDCFNESLDELHLQPYVQRDTTSKTFNIMWQPIDDAARYIVSVFKRIELPNKENIYHLKDYEIDRTINFLSIEGLIGDSFIFVVKAEDRSGNELAKSRGISIGEPKYW